MSRMAGVRAIAALKRGGRVARRGVAAGVGGEAARWVGHGRPGEPRDDDERDLGPRRVHDEQPVRELDRVDARGEDAGLEARSGPP